MSAHLQRVSRGRFGACLLVLGAALCPASTFGKPGGDDPFVRFELENGVRLAVLWVEDAPRQSTFTFLPLGLYHDPADRAQYSHLAEHMLIRSTDPEALEVDGIRINGETTGPLLRLETLAPPDKWRQSIERHVRWVTSREFEAEVLEREKGRIQGEEQSTTDRGATGKWAMAAWAQVVLHGREFAAVHGDVAEADVESIETYVADNVRIGPGVFVVSVGPIAPGEIEQALGRAFAQHPTTAGGPRPSAAQRGPAIWEFGDGQAGWDLEADHYIEWYPLPAGGPAEVAAAILLGNRIGMALMTSEHSALSGGKALVSSDLTTADGRALMVSVALAPDTDLDALREGIRAGFESALKSGWGRPDLSQSIAMMARETSGLPDFIALRKRFQGRGTVELIEAQITLNAAVQELASGMSLPELSAAFEALKVRRVEEIAHSYLKVERRSSLRLTGPD